MTPSRRFAALGAAALLLGAAVTGSAEAIQGDYEAVATAIPVKLTTRLTSADNRPGDRFAFDTTSSVMVDALFLPAGTHGRGVVLAARPARGGVRPRLTVAAETLDLPGGKQLAVALADGGGVLPAAAGPASGTEIVYERGTAFVVVAPPPPSPEP